MQITTAPLGRPPYACVVTGRDDGELIDFEIETPGGNPHLYMRLGVIEEAAKLIGMVPKREVDALAEQLTAFATEIDDLRAQVNAYEQIKEGLDALETVPS